MNPVTEAIPPAPDRPSLLRRLASAPATTTCLAATVLIFFGVSSLGPNPTWADLRAWGYLPAEAIWRGSYWALVTSPFTHFDLWHIAFNAYWLWTLGRRVEIWTGPLWWIVFALGSAVSGSAAQLLASTDTGIGASGIVYALFGLLWRGRSLPEFADALPGKTTQLFLIWLVGCFIATRLGWASIGNAAHVSGLTFGGLVAEWRIRRTRHKLALAGMVGLALMVLFGAIANPWSWRWWRQVGQTAYDRGDYQAAAFSYEQGLASGLDSATAYFYLSVAYDGLNDTARSRAALAVVQRLDSASADSLTAYFTAKARTDTPTQSGVP